MPAARDARGPALARADATRPCAGGPCAPQVHGAHSHAEHRTHADLRASCGRARCCPDGTESSDCGTEASLEALTLAPAPKQKLAEAQVEPGTKTNSDLVLRIRVRGRGRRPGDGVRLLGCVRRRGDLDRTPPEGGCGDDRQVAGTKTAGLRVRRRRVQQFEASSCATQQGRRDCERSFGGAQRSNHRTAGTGRDAVPSDAGVLRSDLPSPGATPVRPPLRDGLRLRDRRRLVPRDAPPRPFSKRQGRREEV